MSETRRTAAFGAVALALVVAALVTAPRVRTPEIFAQRGQQLFPDFTDPNAAASLEVIEFDARDATVRPFKVQNRHGRWTIPSQHDYPTDAKDRLAQTAAAIIALRRDDFATDSPIDHERCGVLDPLDTTLPGLTGRGVRLIVRGTTDQMLADVIVGNPVEGRAGFRYVRQPGQRRVYISNVGDLKPSTSFEDWIERDLLQVGADEIDAVNLRNYSLDRATRRVDPGDTVLLQKGGDGNWSLYGLVAGERLDLAAVDALLRNLAGLTIRGVLPKPAGISATLRGASGSATLDNEEIADLRRKGFYLTGAGQLLSNLGEVLVRTTSGVFYTLRFGELAPGTMENRYLFIMVDFDPRSAATPGRAADAAEKVKLLRARFAPWYYIIAADRVSAIRPQRSDLVTRKAPTARP